MTTETAITFRQWCIVTNKSNDAEGRIIGTIAHAIATWSRLRPGPIRSESELRQHLREIGARRDTIEAAGAVWARYTAARHR
jgi:hypothetical protein